MMRAITRALTTLVRDIHILITSLYKVSGDYGSTALWSDIHWILLENTLHCPEIICMAESPIYLSSSSHSTNTSVHKKDHREFMLCKMLQFVLQATRSTLQSKDNHIQFHATLQWLVMWSGYLRPVWPDSHWQFMTTQFYLSGFNHAFLSTRRSLYSMV